MSLLQGGDAGTGNTKHPAWWLVAGLAIGQAVALLAGLG